MTGSDGNDPDDFAVGFGRPPKHSQFQKGQPSANPKGRPKKDNGNYAERLKAELDSSIKVSENGRRKTRSKADATLKILVREALNGKLGAIDRIIRILPELFALPPQQAVASGVEIGSFDLSTLLALQRAVEQQIEKIRAAQKSASDGEAV